MPKLPTGREKHVTQGGSGVHKRGDGTGLGPVGSAGSHPSGSSGGTGSGSSGSRAGGSGGRSPLTMIILLIVALLGGGGGISALIGGGGSDTETVSSGSSGSSSYTSQSTGSDYSTTSPYGGSYGTTYGNSYGNSYGGGSSGHYGSNNPFAGSGSGSSSPYSQYVQESSSQSSSSQSSSSQGSYSGGMTMEDILESYFGTGSTSDTSTQSGASSYETYSGSGSSIDLSGLSTLFGSGLSQSASGVSGGWVDGGGSVGVLNTSVAKGSRAKFTKLKGNGKDTVTLMIFMCGTDLESGSGMATSDLMEMTKAEISDNVNILVYTGGCKSWRNNIVSSQKNQVYRVREGGIELVVDSDGQKAMTAPETLQTFVKWCAKNYPATRNQLIFWDHGGGSVTGYGYDEKFRSSGSMDLTEIQSAIRASGVKFDFIGFDACLMATAENAMALSDYADYLIASEETEPGLGWYYTNWLTSLSQNTSTPTLDLAKELIDDFVSVSAKKCPGQSTTLSLVDLAELSHTFPDKFAAFAKDTSSKIENSEYKTVSTARNSVREFAKSNRIDQIDLVHLAQNLGTQEGDDLVEVLLSAVKYNRTSPDMTNSYGLSIFFPQRSLSSVSTMVKAYKTLGVDENYTKCIQEYATVSASGQSVSGAGSSPYSILGQFGSSGAYSTGSSGSSGSYSGGSYEGYSSYGDTGTMIDLISLLMGGRSLKNIGLTEENADFLTESGLSEETIAQTLESNWFDASALLWNNTGGAHTMTLPSSQWELVTELEMSMFFDDGEGYIDLGLDNIFNVDENGMLTGDTDRTWLSIDGQPVAYYHISTTQDENGYTIIGRVPCLHNGVRSDLILVFDTDHPYGYVAGVRTDYVDGETDTVAKTQTGLMEGDTLDFLCDYYSYDGSFSDSYLLGEQMTVTGMPEISNTDVGEGGAIVTYRFTDIYGQHYWTEPILE